MNFKKTVACLTLCSMLQSTQFLNAETVALTAEKTTKENKSNTVIVTVSGQKVMLESETGKSIQTRLQTEQQKLAAPLQAEEKKLREKEQKLIETKERLDRDVAEFDKNSKSLTAEERNKKIESLQERAQKLEDDKRDLDRMVQKLQAEARKLEAKMGEVYKKEMAKFEALLQETIKELAQIHHWDIVLMEEAVVFAHQSVSQTKKVIAKLDEKAKAANLAKKQALEKSKDENKKDSKSAMNENKKSSEIIDDQNTY